MNDDLWGDEEPFSDVPDEVSLDANGQPMPAAPAMVRSAPRPTPPAVPPPAKTEEEFVEEYFPEEVDPEEEDMSEVLVDANLRLEQGNLWKLIMKHDLFDGVDADPKAIQTVQKVIRRFAKEQMEIMLGMRQEVKAETLQIDFPFNAMEIEVLKMLAHTATGGKTEDSEGYTPTVKRVTENIPVAPRKQTLNTIGNRSAPPAPPAPKKLQRQPKAPVKRTRLDATIDQVAREEGIPRELLEEDLPGVGGKAYHEMSDSEREERNRLVSQRRGVQVRSKEALPMPSFEQQQYLAEQHVNNVSTNSTGFKQLSKIIEAAKAMPIKSK